MAYYVRLLSKSVAVVPVKDLRAALRRAGSKARIAVEEGSERKWQSILLSAKDGTELVSIERNLVDGPDEMPREELAEFIEEVGDHEPERAARWLQQYLPLVKSIYACQIIADSDWQEDFTPLREELWNRLGGIFQADYEGFSNEDGYSILWQFSDTATGMWWMALLNEDGAWLRFQVNLGNRDHRTAFLAGTVPPSVTVER